MARLSTTLLLLLLLLACGPATPPVDPPPPPAPSTSTPPLPKEAPPEARLPEDVRPTRYRLELSIDPRTDRFTGTVEIDVELTKPRRHIWIHGNELKVTQAQALVGGASMTLTYEQVTDGGVARLTAPEALAAGPATLRLAYDAPFGTRLNGLYKVTSEGQAYAFTQMEPVWGRKVFPSFDEPAFKVPWEVSIIAPTGMVAVANTLQTAEEPAGEGLTRHRYAPTEPLPTYLLAFAVGPLDVVEAPAIAANDARETPLPFRGIAAKGKGKDLAYALKHTPALLTELETYFGIAYPYDKLDIVAVPDKGGAMENAGLVTYRDWLLLLNEEAPTEQKRAFAYVTAHELAHQWFGNLVTMPWWDDIWLNEAFATWMGYRVVHAWDPTYQANVRQVRGVHRAMSDDALVSARQIRQPVTDEDGIHAAFDVITYRKGGGVLSMFERWMGRDDFREGLRAYMKAHRHGNATADDLLAAFSKAAHRDVATPFRTFILQAGLPNVHVALSCEGDKPTVDLRQDCYLPLGSKGDASGQRWQIPVCLRYGKSKEVGETCTLLTEAEATVELDQAQQCPAWLMPNAGAAGYYQWSASEEVLKGLSDNVSVLDVREALSFAKAVRAMMGRGQLGADVGLAVLEPLAAHDHPDVAEAPLGVLSMGRKWLWEDEGLRTKAEERVRDLYARRMARLGWRSRPNETPERKLLRRNHITWLAIVGQDPQTQRKVDQLARTYLGLGGDGKLHPEALEPDLKGNVLYAAGQRADRATFDAIRAHLAAATDPAVRIDLLLALAAATDPKLAEEVRAMMLGDDLKVSERMAPLNHHFHHPATRPDAWAWMNSHMDELMDKLSERRAGWLPSVTTAFCDATKADEMKALFEPYLDRMAGGERELAKAAEALRTCAARRAHLTPGLKKLLR